MIFRFRVRPGEPSTPEFMELTENGGGFPPIVAYIPEEKFTSITEAMRDSSLMDALDGESLMEENSKEESLQGPTRQESMKKTQET